MKPAPFEALHPQEAFFLQNQFAAGFALIGFAEGPLHFSFGTIRRLKRRFTILQRYERSRKNWNVYFPAKT